MSVSFREDPQNPFPRYNKDTHDSDRPRLSWDQSEDGLWLKQWFTRKRGNISHQTGRKLRRVIFVGSGK